MEFLALVIAVLTAVGTPAYTYWLMRRGIEKQESRSVRILTGAATDVVSQMRREFEEIDRRLEASEEENAHIKLELRAKETVIGILERQVRQQGRQIEGMLSDINTFRQESLNDREEIAHLRREVEAAQAREANLTRGIEILCEQLVALGHTPRYRPPPSPPSQQKM